MAPLPRIRRHTWLTVNAEEITARTYLDHEERVLDAWWAEQERTGQAASAWERAMESSNAAA